MKENMVVRHAAASEWGAAAFLCNIYVLKVQQHREPDGIGQRMIFSYGI